MIHELQNNYTGIHPNFWEELNEYLAFETKRQREFYMTIIQELNQEIHKASLEDFEIVHEYEDLLCDYDMLTEECEALYDTIDEMRQQLNERDILIATLMQENIQLKASRLNDDAKTIQYGM